MTDRDRDDRHRPGGDGSPRSPVRPYALTGGRTARDALPPETVVVAAVPDGPAPGRSPEVARILELSRPFRSVAELSALLRLPLGVVRVLVEDLVDDGLVHVHRSSPPSGDTDQLERALRELRKRIR